MPFTISHPAIVLPLKKWFPSYFSLSGLMAGAMSPDLIYFLMVTTEHRGFSHSWIGLFLFCLPAGLLFVAAFHLLFKQHFIFSLPFGLDTRLSGLARSKFRPAGPKGWIVLILSVLVGALSHFFWDSWTHPTGELARQIPWMTSSLQLWGSEVRVSAILQHASTIIGGLAMILLLFKGSLLPAPTDLAPKRSAARKLRFWIAGVFCGLIGSMDAVWIHSGTLTFDFSSLPWDFYLKQKLGLGFWAGFFWAVCGYTIVRRLLTSSIHKRTGQSIT